MCLSGSVLIFRYLLIILYGRKIILSNYESYHDLDTFFEHPPLINKIFLEFFHKENRPFVNTIMTKLNATKPSLEAKRRPITNSRLLCRGQNICAPSIRPSKLIPTRSATWAGLPRTVSGVIPEESSTSSHFDPIFTKLCREV